MEARELEEGVMFEKTRNEIGIYRTLTPKKQDTIQTNRKEVNNSQKVETKAWLLQLRRQHLHSKVILVVSKDMRAG